MSKKCYIYIIFPALFACILPIAAQDGCMETYEEIQRLYDKKDWKGTKRECESYLRHCGSSARVDDILNKAMEELRKEDMHKRIEKLEKEEKWADLIPLCNSYLRLYSSNAKVIQIQKEAEKHVIAEATIPLRKQERTLVEHFSVDEKYITFPEEGGDKFITITSDGDWNISSYPSWVELKKLNDNIVMISCNRNHKTSSREEDIILYNYANKELHITISQDKIKSYLRTSASKIDDKIGAAYKIYTIDVNSNLPWNVKSKPYWCNIEIQGNKLNIKMDNNKTGYARRGEIEIGCAGQPSLRSLIYLEQAALKNYIFLYPNILNDNDGTGGSGTFHVDTDYDDYYIENLPSWCEITQKNSTSFVVNIKDNNGGHAREATCRVVAGDASETFTIRQAERLDYVKVSPNAVNASKNGGTITISITSNTTWRIVNLPDWCEVTEQWENGFNLKVLPNNEYYPRSATFSVSCKGVRENVVVKQTAE